MDAKKQNKIYIAAFIAYTTFFYLFINPIIAYVAARDGIQAFLLSFLGQPANILIIWLLISKSSKQAKFTSAIAGIMIATAFTFVSMPHCVPSSGDFSAVQYENSICTDVITVNHMMSAGINFKLAYFLYYELIPILLVFGALKILGHQKFQQTFEGGGGVAP